MEEVTRPLPPGGASVLLAVLYVIQGLHPTDGANTTMLNTTSYFDNTNSTLGLPLLQTVSPTMAAASGIAFPKSAITGIILAGAVLIGALTAKLVDLIHDRISLQDGASNISEYTRNLLKPLSTNAVAGEMKKMKVKLAWLKCSTSSCWSNGPCQCCLSQGAAVSGSSGDVDADVHVDLEARGAQMTNRENEEVAVLAYTEMSGRPAMMDVDSVSCKVGPMAMSTSIALSVSSNKGTITSAAGLNQLVQPKDVRSSEELNEAMADDVLKDADPLEALPRVNSSTGRLQADIVNRTSTPVVQCSHLLAEPCLDQSASSTWHFASIERSPSTDLAAVHRPSTISGVTDFCSGSMMSIYHGESVPSLPVDILFGCFQHPLDSQCPPSLADSQVTVTPNEPVSEIGSIACFRDPIATSGVVGTVRSGVDSCPSTVVGVITSAANSNGGTTITSAVDINTSATGMRAVDSNKATTIDAITSAVDSRTGYTIDAITSTVDSLVGTTVSGITSAVGSRTGCTVDTITSTVESNAGTTVSTLISAANSNAGTVVTTAVDSNTGTTVGIITSAVDSNLGGTVSGVENHGVAYNWNKTTTKRLKSEKGWTGSSKRTKPVHRAYAKRPSVISYLDAERTYISAFDRRPQTGKTRTRGESELVTKVINGQMLSAGRKKKRAKTAGQMSTGARPLS